ncbi:actin-binding Rho-activating protein [Coregonus clupeaformis]|uniref:actin-binding Rho-activating protein n=1 Tax=Coregonus clupeaformis TaxID=59861 RepID=UPI001E1C930B|nr:actin-binding Rho-activating protein [Coregonus clupeaformis]
MSTSQEDRPFVRAVMKIKCAAMVHSLAKSWQGWANENSVKQETIPSGWMPTSITEDEEREKQNETKILVKTRVVEADSNSGSLIRTGEVTKSHTPKCSEYSSDLVSSIKDKIQMAPEDANKPFLGNESPTRRRLGMRAQVHLGSQERKMGSRSSSLDSEDSGLREEAGLSDNSDQSDLNQLKKQINRPKIRVTTMGDIKSRWQQWSQQHIEGQKLNPFSEEFDYEHAMAQRLQKGDEGYGHPKEGSKTAMRGDRAQKHVYKEMEELCWIVKDMGLKDKNGKSYITFGRLFDRYVKISDKVVGIVLRCRKHKMLDFEGEMLWKGQDDHVIITLRDEKED